MKTFAMRAIKSFTSILSFMLIALFSCSKEDNPSCESLKIGLLSRSDRVVRQEFNHFIKDLGINRYDEGDFNMLVNELDERCDGMTFRKICFGCIYTHPSTSEIEVELDSMGILVKRVNDVSSPTDSQWSFSGLH